jgi:hypothetical protein
MNDIITEVAVHNICPITVLLMHKHLQILAFIY